MKTYIVIFAVIYLSGFTPTCAQQKPQYTQYILNQYIINPAIAGIENYTDIKLSHRHQWAGMDGAPVTTYFTIHTPIGKEDYRTTATSYQVPGENPLGSAYWGNYQSAKLHHGVGLQIINDAAGPLSNFSLYTTYAYHIGISSKTNLAAGIGPGISRYGLDASKLNFATIIDPVIYTSNVINKTNFDMTAGLYLYSADYFVGLSAQQILPSRIDFSDNQITTINGKTVPHLFATAGYRVLLTEDINLTSSIMLKYVQPLPVQPELNFKFQYQDRRNYNLPRD